MFCAYVSDVWMFLVQPKNKKITDMCFNTFRRLIWTDANFATQKSILDNIDKELGSEELRLFGSLFASMLSERFELILLSAKRKRKKKNKKLKLKCQAVRDASPFQSI